jgi:hypothetical protein
MRRLTLIFTVFLAAGCSLDDLSRISILNETTVSIYALPYASEFTEGDWIPPGTYGEFYSINYEALDAFAYFTLYYDSLIVYLKDHDAHPVKFYKDGSTLNYDATMNPFTNNGVWKERKYNRHLSGSARNTMEEKTVFEHYFCIEEKYVKSLSDSIMHELNPAP